MKNSEKQKKIVDKKNERLKKHLKETHTNKTKRKKKEREWEKQMVPIFQIIFHM